MAAKDLNPRELHITVCKPLGSEPSEVHQKKSKNLPFAYRVSIHACSCVKDGDLILFDVHAAAKLFLVWELPGVFFLALFLLSYKMSQIEIKNSLVLEKETQEEQ